MVPQNAKGLLSGAWPVGQKGIPVVFAWALALLAPALGHWTIMLKVEIRVDRPSCNSWRSAVYAEPRT